MRRSPVGFAVLIIALLFGTGLGFVLAKANVLPTTHPFSTYLPALFAQTSRAAATTKLESATTQSVMLGASDFGFKAPYIGVALGVSEAQLHLPQGAQIVQVTLWYSKTNAITYPTDVLLQSQRRSTFTTLASNVIPANEAVGEHELTFAIPPESALIDNQTNGYRIALRPNYGIPDAIIAATQFFDVTQIRVDYRIPSQTATP